MTRKVVFAPEAQLDLLDLYDTIAENGDGEHALGYVERIQAVCLRLAVFSERGTQRDDIRPGLHVVGFERRAAITFHVGAEHMTLARILNGGRDLETVFSEA